MHLRIKAFTKTPCKISYNYQYVLHSAIYSLIQKSSKEYSKFLHHKGFELNERSANDESKISKPISFKNNIKIKAYEAPFTIKANPELIKIGYDCRFGEKNSAGFGMVKIIE